MGRDGRTEYGRLNGKASKSSLCEFGEKVNYMPLKTDAPRSSFAERYKTGIWLGINERNSEVYIGTKEGTVVGSRSIIRIPEADRWDKQLVEGIKGTPWNLHATDDLPTVVFAEDTARTEAAPLPIPKMDTPVPRRMQINRKDLDEYGYTDGCAGCQATRAGLPRRLHSEACRNRLMEALRETPEGQRRIGEAINRIFDHVSNEIKQTSDNPETGTAAVGGQGSQQVPEI